MNILMLFPLTVLTFLTVFNWLSTSSLNEVTYSYGINVLGVFLGVQITLSQTQYFLLVITALIGLSVGLLVLGSLSHSWYPFKMFAVGVFAMGLWAILSQYSLNYVTSIPVYGQLAYFALTFCYAIGTIRFALSTTGET